VIPSWPPTSSSVCGFSPSSPKRSARTRCIRGHAGGRIGIFVLDQVGVEALAVADGRLEADGVLDQLQQLVDALDGEPALGGELLGRRIAVELLREDPAGTEDTPGLLGYVDGKPDRAALVGQRARDGLANPPGRVGGELVAELPVELLDGTDQAEVALLDQVEQWNAGLRVVARDRHDQAQVALDQPLLRDLVARILAPGELALLRGRQQRAVADLADVELQRVLRRAGCLALFALLGVLRVFGLVVRLGFCVLSRRKQLEVRLRRCVEVALGKWPLCHREPCIGAPEEDLDDRANPRSRDAGGAPETVSCPCGPSRAKASHFSYKPAGQACVLGKQGDRLDTVLPNPGLSD
jgi:hypothetical protein